MIWTELAIPGAWLITLEPQTDERGSYTRIWDEEEAHARGLSTDFIQAGISSNPIIGTIRGLHYQAPPDQEAKLIHCVGGAVWDVIVDLRTYQCLEQRLGMLQTLYVPPNCAHGFQTLTANVDLFYQMTAPYIAESQRGIRWDDPSLKIQWPRSVSLISKRDRSFEWLEITATS